MKHSNNNPRAGQYLTHAHSHITWAVAAMDGCFGLVRPHQHGIAVGQKKKKGLKALCMLSFTAEAGTKHPFKCQLEIRCSRRNILTRSHTYTLWSYFFLIFVFSSWKWSVFRYHPVIQLHTYILYLFQKQIIYTNQEKVLLEKEIERLTLYKKLP